MERKNSLQLILTGGLLLFFLVGCGEQAIPTTPTLISPTATPTPIPLTATLAPTPTPALRGKLIGYDSNGVFVLTSDQANGEIKEIRFSKIAAGAATISPNNQYLLLGSTGPEFKFTLVELSTLEATILFSASSVISCLVWNPDSTNFSYMVNHSLNIYNITTQESTLIFEAPSASYKREGFPDSEISGGLGCGIWIGQESLVFQRFVGPMPSRVTEPTRPEISANKTTRALLVGNAIRLVDSPERFFVADVSKDALHILVEKENVLYIANSFSEFADMKLRPLDLHGQDVGFRNTNEVIMNDKSVVSIVDPETLQIKESFTIPVDWQIPDFPFAPSVSQFSLGVWVGEPSDGIYIWADQNRIHMGDLNTGVKTNLWEATNNEFGLLGWVP
jgi:hypothetical protein